MNYAIPSYVCNKQAMTGNFPFICTVEIGGIQYIGAAAKTKKEAEIKAARTALLAIQSKTGIYSIPLLLKVHFGCIARFNWPEYVGAVDFYLFHVSVLELLRFEKLGRSLKTALKFSLNQNLNSSI